MEKCNIGPVPYNEDCEQLGDDYRKPVALLECKVFISQLKRLNGDPPEGTSYVITSNLHDFGTYHDVAITFDDKKGREYAYRVEDEVPEDWDYQAKKELNEGLIALGYSPRFILTPTE